MGRKYRVPEALSLVPLDYIITVLFVLCVRFSKNHSFFAAKCSLFRSRLQVVMMLAQ